MQSMCSGLHSSESLMAGITLLRDRDEQGLGSCGGTNAADADLLNEMSELRRLQAW